MFISDRNRIMICSSYLVMAYAKLCNMNYDKDVKGY